MTSRGKSTNKRTESTEIRMTESVQIPVDIQYDREVTATADFTNWWSIIVDKSW